jgi:hypothetical protein
MKIISFSLLTVLALVYASLTMAETMTYHKWEKAINEQKYTQAKLAYFNNLNSLLERLARQLALDSQSDPALAQLLKDNKIKVVIGSPQTVGDVPAAGSPSPATNAPQSPDKPVQAPGGTP